MRREYKLKKLIFLIVFIIMILFLGILLYLTNNKTILKSSTNIITLYKDDNSKKYFIDNTIDKDTLLIIEKNFDINQNQNPIINITLYKHKFLNIWESIQEQHLIVDKEFGWEQVLINKDPEKYLVFGYLKTSDKKTISIDGINVDKLIKLTDDIYIWYESANNDLIHVKLIE